MADPTKIVTNTNQQRAERCTTVGIMPYDEAYEAGFEHMRRRVPDLSRIHSGIGWSPRIPFEDTLRDVIAFHCAK